MCDEPKIENRIAAILTGSGLPLERRKEIAAELRCHLEQSIASKRAAGVPGPQATEAALAEFGSPRAIRRQLRRQQRMLDRRQAAAKFRRWHIWWVLTYAGFFSLPIIIAAPQGTSLLTRSLTGLAVFACLLLLTTGFTYAGTVLGYQLERPRPRSEYHFARSFLYWVLIAGLGFAVLALMALVMVPIWAPLGPLYFHLPWLVWWHNLAVAWMGSASRNLCVLGMLAFGLTAALYERSRCVDG